MLHELRRCLPDGVKRRLANTTWLGPLLYRVDSFTPEGEDLILATLLTENQRGNLSEISGFYVDIGAHHPMRHSTTFKFYRAGWRGINIDPNPGSMQLFRRLRPNDINLELAVGPESGALTYYRFDEPALNTCVADRVAFLAKQGYAPRERIAVQAFPLRAIFTEYLPPGQAVTFASVDVEGHELAVLTSNDWSRFRPTYLVVEQLRDYPGARDVRHFLRQQGYAPLARTFRSMIYGQNGSAM
jgi:FkbM family methyltransferase